MSFALGLAIGLGGRASGGSQAGDSLLLETGDYLLLETGDKLLLE